MHRDVKPHNVMIDHENRKVSASGIWVGDIANNDIAAPHRLGFGRILPPRYRVQREGKHFKSLILILETDSLSGSF